MKLRNQSCQLILGHYTLHSISHIDGTEILVFHRDKKGVRSR